MDDIYNITIELGIMIETVSFMQYFHLSQVIKIKKNFSTGIVRFVCLTRNIEQFNIIIACYLFENCDLWIRKL